MKTKEKLVYVHGLSSSGVTGSAKNLQLCFPEYEVLAPDMPMDPIVALQLLKDICKKHRPLVVVGTSMGGMFTQQLHGQKKILVNPAFRISELMRQDLGEHPFINPRKDGVKTFTLTEELCEQYEAMEKLQFEGITNYDRKYTYGLFGTKDTLVNCQAEFDAHYKNKVLFEGEHRLNMGVIVDYVVPLIGELVDDF